MHTRIPRGRQGHLYLPELYSGAGVDPVTLPLTMFHRASYSASPWAGTASGGSSGSSNMASATPPSTGTAVDGFVPAKFNGTTQFLESSLAVEQYVGTGQWSGWVVVKPNTVTSNGTPAHNNHAILGTKSSARLTVYLRDNSGPKVGLAFFTSAGDVVVETPVNTAVYSFVRFGKNSTHIFIQVAGGAMATAPALASSIGTGFTLNMGGNTSYNVFSDADVLEVALTNQLLSAATIDEVMAFDTARYGL